MNKNANSFSSKHLEDIVIPGMFRRTKRQSILLFALCIITVLVIVMFKFQKLNRANDIFQKSKHFDIPAQPAQLPSPRNEKIKLFHLDLKGAPPKMSYLLKILPMIRKAGANGLLLEYEDMFPWHGILKNISANNAYTKAEIKSLLRLAQALGMEVIPLVQTFGHLEFVLKLQEFRHLRELDSFPQEICPSKLEAIHVIKEMIKQMMALHEGVRYLHIGCDEVYHIAACPVCSQKNARAIFTAHVTLMGQFVRLQYPGITPIIWDDMLRRWSPVDIEETELGKIVEPMVWVYIEDIPRLVPHFIWFTYKKTFPKIWGASAFKGAFGEKEVLPDLPRHIENNLAWLRIMKPNPKESNVMSEEDFRGLAITGWSRYDHFAVLAELLPVAFPSLILNLALINSYLETPYGTNVESFAFKKMSDILNCPDNIPFHSIDELKREKNQWSFGHCDYPGRNLYLLIGQLYNLQGRLNVVMGQKYSNGWVSDYNIKYNYSSPFRVLELYQDEGFAAQTLKKHVVNFKQEIRRCLGEFYDKYTVEEWIEQKIEPMELSLQELEKTFQTLVEKKVWPRRPL